MAATPPPTSPLVDGDDPAFDRALARTWLLRTWGFAGAALALVALSMCFNPFGIVGVVAIAACVAGGFRALRPPEVVRPSLNGRHLIPGILALLAIVPAVLSVVISFGLMAWFAWN